MRSLKNQEGLIREQCALCWATAYLLVFNSFSILLQWLYFLTTYVCFIPILNWPDFSFLFSFYSLVKKKKRGQMVLSLNRSCFVNL